MISITYLTNEFDLGILVPTMNYRDKATLGLMAFPIYILARVGFDVPIWVDLIMGILLALMILPTLFFRSAAAGTAIIALFILAFPSFSEMDGRLGKSGLLFFFALWVILIVIIAIDRSKRG